MMRLFLVLFIVCLGLSYVHPENEVEANPSKIQESFHSFFNSIGNNNGPQTKIYRNLLEREAVKERQAFDLAKEELQETRRRYPRKQRNPPHSDGEIRAKAAVSKREATEDKDETGISSQGASSNQLELEDQFVGHFGDNNTNFKGWQPIRDWYMEDGEPKLRELCANAHKKANKEEIDNINVVIMRPRLLTFSKYQPKRVDVVAYGVADPKAQNPDLLYWHTPEGQHWYITEGLKPDCVFYATIPNITTGAFVLTDYVCGFEVPK